uniref:Apolipoprotein F n=1 Tax=Dromaius novaehollandiae TaxID=8790 RepID=A0A8C4JAQ7_DRONO
MRWALPCLLLCLHAAAGSTVPPGPDAAAAARALLARLSASAPPRALPGAAGVSCQDLQPDALPGFSRLPALPRVLAQAALALALSRAACGPQAEALVLELYRELEGPTAEALLQGLVQLQGAPGRGRLPLLLGLAQLGASVPWGIQARRSSEDSCSPAGEWEVHSVLEWVPGVSTLYNLGTSLYYAYQGCEELASERAWEAAIDLGYDGLAVLGAGAGGPVAYGVHLGLQPGLKAGVRALICYFTSDEDPPLWSCPIPVPHPWSLLHLCPCVPSRVPVPNACPCP